MSTIRVNTLQNTSTTDGGISINNSGHVTMDGVSYPSAGPLSNRNLIINGAMQVAQRGTSSTASGYGTVDRFRPGYGGGTQTQSQVAITSGDPYDEGFRYILRLTNTASATGASNNRNIRYAIEAQDIAASGWNYTSSTSYITLSFWVRASVAQTYYVRFQTKDGTNISYGSAFTLSADTWTKVTKTIPGNSSMTFDNDTGIGLYIFFVPFDGTDFTDSSFTTDAWGTYSSSNRLPDMTNTWAGTTDATFDVTGVQLEVGSVATPFEHRSYGDELARCQRYFYAHNCADTYNMVGMGFYTGTTSWIGMHTVPVPFRAAPSISTSGNFQTAHDSGNSTATGIVLADEPGGNVLLQIRCTTSSTPSGEGAFLRNNNDATATFTLNAEL